MHSETHHPTPESEMVFLIEKLHVLQVPAVRAPVAPWTFQGRTCHIITSLCMTCMKQYLQSWQSGYSPPLLEHKRGLPCSQQSAIGPCPEPDESSTHPIPTYSPFEYSLLSFSFRYADYKYAHISYISHACYTLLPTHTPWLSILNSLGEN